MKLSKIEFEDFKERIFQYYRRVGFPYQTIPELSERKKALDKLNLLFKKKDDILDLKTKVIRQALNGLTLAWHYFPHAWNVKCISQLTVMEAFNNDKIFKKFIEKRLKHDNFFSDARVRGAIKINTSVQMVSNFRPTAARAIYDHFLKENSTVYDMSCGFGGRLLGAISSPKVKHYIGTDPSSKTYKGLLDIVKDLKPEDMEITLYQVGSEDVPVSKHKEQVDLCFTSPPYFDTEKYSEEETQSYMKYKNKDSWLNNFLSDTIDNCYDMLKFSGYLIINIANVKSYLTLEEDFVKLMKGKNSKFEYTDTYKLALSGVNGTGYKYEPVFVYKKI